MRVDSPGKPLGACCNPLLLAVDCAIATAVSVFENSLADGELRCIADLRP